MTLQEEIQQITQSKGIKSIHVEMMLSFFQSSAFMTATKRTGKNFSALSQEDKDKGMQLVESLKTCASIDEYDKAVEEINTLFSSDGINVMDEYEATYEQLLKKFLEKMKTSK
ncbi:MAG: hypothetical protein GW762_02345 [Candidatus Pacebacteria bacterium]|nr:hypothetical protein [Candidatus Paceibacterota bacterium]PIR63598.1 MAG: hypothetical protein COU64_03305 [Candidatus Pacebacteria bacterium CG10_big_fil_rev_8_21_14_0_10_40_26]PIZ78700.1 MAG: hypothetical protein COY01_03675 [Candidatus Pacebacteria bacterium CG_4_10_14_0_2_um_filter_40_20]PJA68448.1 MAG: hypothetical protein CO156_05640 [Candidatus Pacebacteria bacterium CG_4_9_14_3_um_filter_40_12]PJC41310.1 MAG: hypothetical protein CO041_05710 [Candidatus Pacebacteria bacterium CG_4_9_